jgi:RNA polymerase sigma factor (sigma-70 family)
LIFRAVEDADLISRIRKGDIEAFNILVSRWEKRVFNYLLRLLGSPDDALDLSQEVLLKAYQNIRKLEDPARFGPWLFRIAHNETYSFFRKRRPETSLDEDPTLLDRAAAPGSASNWPMSTASANRTDTPPFRPKPSPPFAESVRCWRSPNRRRPACRPRTMPAMSAAPSRCSSGIRTAGPVS